MRGKGTKQRVSSDGVPNRKGGSWPNHPAMRYELPIPFSPGAENVTEDYRTGYCRTFGCRPGCGHDVPVATAAEKCRTPRCMGHDTGPEGIQLCRIPNDWTFLIICPVCAEHGFHKLGPGRWTCEEDLS